MAESISTDPAFAQMTAALQQSFGGGGIPGMPGGMPGGIPGGMPGMPGGPEGAAGAASFDPAQYMQAMSGVLQNPAFMQMAEKLGSQIMQARRVTTCMGICVTAAQLTPSLVLEARCCDA